MYIYDKQSDIMHRNYPKYSNLENRWFCYIIWAPDLRNHQICKKILSLHRDFHIYKSMFYSFQSNGTKNKKVLVFSYSSYFFVTTGPIFYPMTSLWAAITSKRRLGHPKPIIFSESWVLKDSVGTGPEKCSRWKFLGTERCTKKITKFLWKNFAGSILMPQTFHIASLNRHTPKLSRI